MIDLDKVFISTHARQRAEEMEVSTNAIFDLVRDPSVVYPNSRRYPGRRVHLSTKHPRVGVVVTDTSWGGVCVVTVIWNTHKTYVRPEHERIRPKKGKP